MTDQSQTRESGLRTVTVSVNETRYASEVEPRQMLVYFIRDQLGLTGTHVGCDTSQRAACTILLAGIAVKSGTVLAIQADGAAIKTPAGHVQPNATLHAVQQPF